MRTDPQILHALAFAPTDRRDRTALGDLMLPRTALDLSRRRIGPLSLRERPHHRVAWLNLLLPFCPESLELLVDECPAPGCGPLGWRCTRGVSNCEWCGSPVPPAEQAGLAEAAAESYRLFADLVSRDPAVGADAVRQLPTSLQMFSRTALAGVAVRGGMISELRPTRRNLDKLLAEDPVMIADAIVTGMRLLTGWPGSIRLFAEKRATEKGGDLAAYNRVREDLRWMAQGSIDGRSMLEAAFPKLYAQNGNMFADEGRYYSTEQASMCFSLSSKEMEILREEKAIRYEALPGGQRARVRYAADDLERLHALLRDSIAPRAAAARLDLPVYAIGQIVSTGRLSIQGQPGVIALRGLQVEEASVHDLRDALLAAASRGPAPAGFIPIKTVMRRFPGEKPWSSAVEAMLSGSLQFHLVGDALAVRSVLVDPIRFLPLEAASSDPLELAHISLRDAGEILVTGFEETNAAIANAGIMIVRHGRGKAVARADLRRLVSDIAFAGEAAERTGRTTRAMNSELVRLDVRRVYGAWCRGTLVRLGLVDDLRC